MTAMANNIFWLKPHLGEWIGFKQRSANAAFDQNEHEQHGCDSNQRDRGDLAGREPKQCVTSVFRSIEQIAYSIQWPTVFGGWRWAIAIGTILGRQIQRRCDRIVPGVTFGFSLLQSSALLWLACRACNHDANPSRARPACSESSNDQRRGCARQLRLGRAPQGTVPRPQCRRSESCRLHCLPCRPGIRSFP